MWSFEVLANINSMFSISCNSMKNGNNNITMILTSDDICINVKILIVHSFISHISCLNTYIHIKVN